MRFSNSNRQISLYPRISKLFTNTSTGQPLDDAGICQVLKQRNSGIITFQKTTKIAVCLFNAVHFVSF